MQKKKSNSCKKEVSTKKKVEYDCNRNLGEKQQSFTEKKEVLATEKKKKKITLTDAKKEKNKKKERKLNFAPKKRKRKS